MVDSKKYLYFFGGKKTEGKGAMKDILGGKGANLAEMSRLGVPIPPGFTISTAVCRLYYESGQKFPPALEKTYIKYIQMLESATGKKFSDPVNPLLVSVRSGAKFSMPGMMDTILNVGMNDQTVEGLAKLTNNPDFAYDCYRRLLMMFGEVVLEIEYAKNLGMSEGSNKDKVAKLKKLILERSGKPFPQDPLVQLSMARDAVFRSWRNPRANAYRAMYKIPEEIGTAVNIQTMVFGNLGMTSATGVGFTRNPANGEKKFYGEYLTNAQGEDVVAGIRTPQPITKLADEMPEAFKQLRGITDRLEKHYRDIQDFEFTIEKGKLYMLQTRNGKRTGYAAMRIAVDMVEEKLISIKEAVLRIEPDQINQVLHPIFDLEARKKAKVIAKGLNASPGAASGKAVFNAVDAVHQAQKGERVVLVRMETSPDDVEGMIKARGVLTATGGMTSHAAVVGRQMGKPCVVGCSVIKVSEKHKRFTSGNVTVKEGDFISIDGSTGEVFLGDIKTNDSEIMQVVKGTLAPEKSKMFQDFNKLLSWADKFRTLGVEANADIPRDADMAIKFGAMGIGLCRTEHMFFAPDRLPIVQEMILAETEELRRKALNKLLPLQRDDFFRLFDIMKGYPVTIRMIDPPLHEFLPKREELMVEITTIKFEGSREPDEIVAKEKLLKRVEELSEFNPMMGHRGCRLGITYPEITEMQVRAIIEAACAVAKKGKKVQPEIMIPIVGHVNEIKDQKAIAVRVAEQVMKEQCIRVHYKVGTMIEIPRAALTAEKIALEAEFFSFGTNDLTQMTFGFSRDDAGRFIKYYVANKILPYDPFVSIDEDGVGQLIAMAAAKGRKARKGIRIGICGEHGGDPQSIHFCHKVGLDYVSASPYRVPIARLAAAHAALKE
ncbi:MAG: pyruvate, phosphate dikinase [Candidatus Brocadiia bacterium]